MTEAERIARAHRAQSAWDEFFGPMVDEMRSEYQGRMVDIASVELSRDKRADKLTALAHALKILGNLENGMLAAIKDGDMARSEKLRKEKIEQMTAPQRRLLRIAG
jgi:hypothetical protein